jgi:GTP-binding protein HflX
MSGKHWSAQSIRALARKKLEKFDSNETQSHKPIVGNVDFEFEFGRFEKARGDKVILVCPVVAGRSQDLQESEQDLVEMKSLCTTLGLQVIRSQTLHLKKGPSAKSYITKGHLEQLAKDLKTLGAVALVLDAPLTPGQIKNIETVLEAPVIDREGVILSIFEKHAQSSLSKMQVELARLKYLQPRLAGLWMGLSRQSSGKAGQGGRGLGETRLELDRRTVKDRISQLSRKLKLAEKHFRVRSQSRDSKPRVALVGYTNAGKSTLMNRLTHAKVLESDKLFATLDTTVRQLIPPTNPPILVSDTVGFVKKLPTQFVASFKSTLQEAVECPLLLLVVDCASKRVFQDFQVTYDLLQEIGLKNQSVFVVLNKMDLIPEKMRKIKELEFRKHFQAEFPEYPLFFVSGISQTASEIAQIEILKDEIKKHFGVAHPAWMTNAQKIENLSLHE